MTRRKKSTKQEPVKEETVDLATKYRPQSIDELYGNALLKKSIKSVLDRKEIPHAVLLHGAFGCGKTTIARILAKELDCSDFDLKEIDIADFTGVDLIREIRRKMHQKPMKGKSKVYILDEVQKLSDAGQQALLKALEEPPKHCYFFLCTTDPQKIINTVKSRCVQYTVQTLSDKQIYTLLQDVANREEIDLEKKVGLQIARDSLGHPRNALKILDRIKHLEPEDMLEAAKDEAEKREQVIALCRALNEGRNWSELAKVLQGIKEEPEDVRRAIRGYFAKVLLGGDESAFIILDVFQEPYYSTDGKNQLIHNVYEAMQSLKD